MADSDQNRNIFSIITVPFYVILVMWAIHLLKLSLNLDLGAYGLLPRDSKGLIGIFTSPFIHGSIKHLVSNSIPLFVLMTMIIAFYRRVAYPSIFLIYVLTGVAVWMLGRGRVIHIGASGVVYGLVTFVFWTGIFRRNVKSIILALVVTILYSGFFMGVLPNQKGISWESHLFGAMVGILVAFWFKNVKETDEIETNPWADEPESSTNFLSPDTFEKTKAQRALEERLRRQNDETGFWTRDQS